MRSGFAHFDNSHRENFCAAVLLLMLDADDVMRTSIDAILRGIFALDETHTLAEYGREARLAETDDDNYARVDLWFRFEQGASSFFVFLEVKTHDRWDAIEVARQVEDQAQRQLARNHRQIRGVVLLGPDRLCRRVQRANPAVRTLTWGKLLRELRGAGSSSALTELGLRHLEENMERTPGIDRPLTLDAFETATTTVACLRECLVGCVADIGGRVRQDVLYTTPGDGEPRRSGGWAWHGLAVPFTLIEEKGRLGIYKYTTTPKGEEEAATSLWLEVYLGDASEPLLAIPFAPPTLEAAHLDALRAAFENKWTDHRSRNEVGVGSSLNS